VNPDYYLFPMPIEQMFPLEQVNKILASINCARSICKTTCAEAKRQYKLTCLRAHKTQKAELKRQAPILESLTQKILKNTKYQGDTMKIKFHGDAKHPINEALLRAFVTGCQALRPAQDSISIESQFLEILKIGSSSKEIAPREKIPSLRAAMGF